MTHGIVHFTGTSVPYVVTDFLDRAAAGTLIGTNLTSTMLQRLAAQGAKSKLRSQPHVVASVGDDTATFTASGDDALASMCDGATVPVILYNSLAHSRRQVVRIGIDCNDVAVTMRSGDAMVAVPAQVDLNHTLQVPPIAPAPSAAPAPAPPAPPTSSKYNLFVLVEMPPVGFTTVRWPTGRRCGVRAYEWSDSHHCTGVLDWQRHRVVCWPRCTRCCQPPHTCSAERAYHLQWRAVVGVQQDHRRVACSDCGRRPGCRGARVHGVRQ